MKYKKEYLCDSCYNAEIRIITSYKPIYASSSLANKVQNLSIWCNFKYTFIKKLPTFRERNKCNYRPKAGIINNHITQKQLSE